MSKIESRFMNNNVSVQYIISTISVLNRGKNNFINCRKNLYSTLIIKHLKKNIYLTNFPLSLSNSQTCFRLLSLIRMRCVKLL